MTDTAPIAARFADLRSRGRLAFMPFVTAGDPDMATTLELVGELSRRGVDLIEVGFPYSDPIADGPVIQASYTRALERGVHLADIFAGIGGLKSNADVPPLVAMVSYAIIFRHGVERFLDEAGGAGFAGMIVPDLPGDEAAELFEAAHLRGLDLIQLVSPMTPPDRVERILQACSGFVYCISIAGTTGERDRLPEHLENYLRTLREQTDLPLAVGFGISQPEQAAALRGLADGVIVGSAVVRRLEGLAEGAKDAGGVVGEVGEFAGRMLRACRGEDRL